jgi:hypothetical protein
MAVRLPNGAILQIASAYDASSKTMSAVTNANPGVATLSDGLLSAGDFVVVTSGWAKLNNRVVKLGTPATDAYPLTGIDTSDTTKYPAGSGTGSVLRVSTWQQISQVLDLTGQGGDQQFTTYEFLESDDQYQIPTVRSPQSLQFHIADDTTLPHYAILSAADADRQPRALKITLPGGSVLTYNAYITMNPTPSLTKGQVMALAITASLLALPVRY